MPDLPRDVAALEDTFRPFFESVRDHAEEDRCPALLHGNRMPIAKPLEPDPLAGALASLTGRSVA